jgi:uncharacterized repeat protein (TIGR02543 family)
MVLIGGVLWVCLTFLYGVFGTGCNRFLDYDLRGRSSSSSSESSASSEGASSSASVSDVGTAFIVTFAAGGGSAVSAQAVSAGGYVREPQGMAREGHVFEGWYTESSFINKWDFAQNTVTENMVLYAYWLPGFTVSNTGEWVAAASAIAGGGDNKNYVINITADFSVAGRITATFGEGSNITVTIRGAGQTLALSGAGNILRAGAAQTIILQDVVLLGSNANTGSLVYVDGVGTVIMHSGKISGNTITDTQDGGGVYVLNQGYFILYGGEISGNTATGNGGGVYVSGTPSSGKGTFTMHGGEISGNHANFSGGGVSVTGTLEISEGVIYGSDAAEDKRNTVLMGEGAALHNNGGTAGYGGYNGTNAGDNFVMLDTTDATIRVEGGVRQQ